MNQQDILNRRKEVLAKPLAVSSKEEQIELLVFSLAREQYAIEARYVQEVGSSTGFTSLPGVPPFLLGLLNVRSRILPLLDLKIFFELPASQVDAQKYVILKGEEKEFAILIDELLGMQKLPLNQLQTALPTQTGVREEFLRGIVSNLTVLDGKKLLLSKELIIDERI